MRIVLPGLKTVVICACSPSAVTYAEHLAQNLMYAMTGALSYLLYMFWLLTPFATFGCSDEVSRSSSVHNMPPLPLSERDILLWDMAEVDEELLRWEKFVWAGIDAMGTVNLVEFWKVSPL